MSRYDEDSVVANDREEARTERQRSNYTRHEERYGLDAPSRAEAEEDR